MTTLISLRDVIESDLPVFFEQQRDPAANHRAAEVEEYILRKETP